AAAGDYGGTGESDHRDQSSRCVREGEKSREIFVAETAGEQSSGQCVRRWRAISRRKVFGGIGRAYRAQKGHPVLANVKCRTREWSRRESSDIDCKTRGARELDLVIRVTDIALTATVIRATDTAI